MNRRLWEMTYRADRRKHRHRCRCCWQTVQDGESVLMLKLRNSRFTTWALHLDCAEMPHLDGLTWRDAFRGWAGEAA